MISVTTPPDTTPAQKLWIEEEGRLTFAATMDSVKVWDLEKAAQADIIMKPQSVIFDMRGNSEFLYCKFVISNRLQWPSSAASIRR